MNKKNKNPIKQASCKGCCKETELLRQIKLERYSSVKQLTKYRGNDIDHYNECLKESALTIAIENENMVMAKFVLGCAANPNIPENECRPINRAIKKNNIEMVKLLIEHEVDLNPEDARPYSSNPPPLVFAVLENNISMVELILTYGGRRVSLENRNDAFLLAIDESHQDIAQILLDHGAEINCRDPLGNTALMNALASNKSSSLIKFLLDRWAFPNVLGDKGKSPIVYAIEHGRKDVIQLLIDRGAELTSKQSKLIKLMN